MTTEAQILANRSNAQESTGPKTTEGKATVSQNAVKHGLTAQKTVITGENLADFELYRYEMIEELDPIGPMESMLADRVVSLSWRLKRTVRIQDETIHALCAPKPLSALDKLTKSMVRQVTGQIQPDVDEASPLSRIIIKDFSNARVLDRLMMYERRIESSLYKTVNELRKLTLIRKLDITPNRSPFMQNKPNLPNDKMNLTSYEHNSYEPEPPLPTPPKQTQFPIEDPAPSPIPIEDPGAPGIEPTPPHRASIL
jgi:hypothetical protein